MFKAIPVVLEYLSVGSCRMLRIRGGRITLIPSLGAEKSTPSLKLRARAQLWVDDSQVGAGIEHKIEPSLAIVAAPMAFDSFWLLDSWLYSWQRMDESTSYGAGSDKNTVILSVAADREMTDG
jgi:hypothetical protein